MCTLSILITTYNQSELLKTNLAEIIKYKGNDIEVVVSDNCSTEDIASVITSFEDSRIKYYRNSINEGQDGNILFGMKHCKGDYIYLFRTRDVIISNKIPDVLECIKNHPNAVFFLFSSLNEIGEVRQQLPDKEYRQFKEAVYAHDKLLVHPSGMLYRRNALNIGIVEKYIKKYFDDNYSFIAHQMIRMDLSQKGSFVTSSIYAWKYARSNMVKGKSGVLESGRGDPHAPQYHNRRFSCEMDFAYNEIPKPYNMEFCKQLIRKFFVFETVFYPLMIRDIGYVQHYGNERESYSRIETIRNFYSHASREIDTISHFDKDELNAFLEKTKRKIPLNILRAESCHFINENKCLRIVLYPLRKLYHIVKLT
ncbi:glycosyltransferase family 2 protein [Selenomonas ruminantium]|uniref:Glycosyltransferase involved in cell wall bisynthesis n=1 Tax=Selenomonas ruminantium TaxID=971 RepID=A0A1H0PNQ5_SELRU|nr:glycosyltransferase family 2 protein [Selenomonas ruminantium]SDP06430.1 Glycosyltransferase involved in cell wall bisynthesis [Selenomonas ruminantium]